MPITLLLLFIYYKSNRKLINLLFFILIFNSFFISQFTEIKHYALTTSLSLVFLFLISEKPKTAKKDNLNIGFLFFISTLLILHRYMLSPSILILLILYGIERMQSPKKTNNVFSLISASAGAIFALILIYIITKINPIKIYSLYSADRVLISYIPFTIKKLSNFFGILTLQNFFLIITITIGILFLACKKEFKQNKSQTNKLIINSVIFCVTFVTFYILKSPIIDSIHLFNLIGPISLLCATIILYIENFYASLSFLLIYSALYLTPATILLGKSYVKGNSDACGYYYLLRAENFITQKKYAENIDCYRKIETIYKTKNFLNKVAPYLEEGDEILSWLTQTAAMTKIKQAVGFEGGVGTNEIIWSDTVNFSSSDAKNLNLLTKEDLILKLKQNYFKLIIEDPYMEEKFKKIIKEQNYQVIYSVGEIDKQKYIVWANNNFAEKLKHLNLKY